MIGLVDADIIAYKCAFACQSAEHTLIVKGNPYFKGSKQEIKKFIKDHDVKDYEIDTKVNLLPVPEMYKMIDGMIKGIVTKCTDDLEFYMTGVNNFRKDLSVTNPYKPGRVRPAYIEQAKAYLVQKYKAMMCNGWEADDELFRRRVNLEGKGVDNVIISIDKDLLTIPGWHYNIDREEFTYITLDIAENRLLTQILTGDNTDGIKGLPRIGEVAAKKILDVTPELRREAVVEAYAKNTPKELDWRDYLIEQANLIYIRFDPDRGITLDEGDNLVIPDFLDVIGAKENLVENTS